MYTVDLPMYGPTRAQVAMLIPVVDRLMAVRHSLKPYAVTSNIYGNRHHFAAESLGQVTGGMLGQTTLRNIEGYLHG